MKEALVSGHEWVILQAFCWLNPNSLLLRCQFKQLSLSVDLICEISHTQKKTTAHFSVFLDLLQHNETKSACLCTLRAALTHPAVVFVLHRSRR